MMHWLFTEALIDERTEDPDRFRIGSLLPDAYENPASRRTTHFVKRIENEDGSVLRFCQFDVFLARFEEKIRTDDLYRGYAMHLAEDAVTRAFWKKENLRIPPPPEGAEMLHSDYHLLNRYLVETRSLRFHARMPEDFAREEIMEVYPFDLPSFLKEFEKDFHDPAEGELQILSIPFTEQMIAEAMPILRQIKEDLLRENKMPEPSRFVW